MNLGKYTIYSIHVFISIILLSIVLISGCLSNNNHQELTTTDNNISQPITTQPQNNDLILENLDSNETNLEEDIGDIDPDLI